MIGGDNPISKELSFSVHVLLCLWELSIFYLNFTFQSVGYRYDGALTVTSPSNLSRFFAISDGKRKHPEVSKTTVNVVYKATKKCTYQVGLSKNCVIVEEWFASPRNTRRKNDSFLWCHKKVMLSYACWCPLSQMQQRECLKGSTNKMSLDRARHDSNQLPHWFRFQM